MFDFTTTNTALVLVDHQVGTINWVGSVRPEQREQIKVWARLLARFAKGAGIPVVLTSSLEDQAQGLLLPDFADILPEAYTNRVKRDGVINAWDDPHFADAVRQTGKKNLLMAGLTTDVCLVPPAIGAKKEGFNVVALMDASGACTELAEETSRTLLNQNGVHTMTTIPMLTSLLGNWNNPASGAFFEAMEKENVLDLLDKGSIR